MKLKKVFPRGKSQTLGQLLDAAQKKYPDTPTGALKERVRGHLDKHVQTGRVQVTGTGITARYTWTADLEDASSPPAPPPDPAPPSTDGADPNTDTDNNT